MAPPVIWGLDLAELQWYKFGSNYMFNNKDYHLRRTKFIVYQCALIFCVLSESLATAALSDMIDAQAFVKRLDPNVYVYNNDYVGVGSFNIFAGVFVAFIFGAAFFFDLFWPARKESRAVMLAWQICGVLAVMFMTASAFALTVITAMRCQYFRSVDDILFSTAYAESLLRQFKKDGGLPLCYRDNGRAVAAVVFVWLGLLSVVGSCIILFMSIRHYKQLGPYSKQGHTAMAEKNPGPEMVHELHGESRAPQQPAAVHQAAAVNGQVDGAATKTPG